nr:hypothetical protein Iba_scaffold45219CG0010 [Ipomoea batatas]
MLQRVLDDHWKGGKCTDLDYKLLIQNCPEGFVVGGIASRIIFNATERKRNTARHLSPSEPRQHKQHGALHNSSSSTISPRPVDRPLPSESRRPGSEPISTDPCLMSTSAAESRKASILRAR